MSDTEPISRPKNTDLEWQVEALQRQVFLLLLGLVVVSATLVFYLYCESRFIGNDLAEVQPQAVQIIRAYNGNAQAFQQFRLQLGNYAIAHPGFQPVLKKYGWMPPVTALK
jgi:hypothetical protein